MGIKKWLVANRTDVMQAILLVGLAATVRLAFRDVPNFAPIAAVALFAGFRSQSVWLATLVPVAAMGLSDFWIGGYDTITMVVVYASLTAPVLAGQWLRAHEATGSSLLKRWTFLGSGVLATSLAGSLLFFLTTNLASWLRFGIYTNDLAGLLLCYTQALPFFRFTLAGDLCFATVLFGGYVLYQQLSTTRNLLPSK